jgi:hypothetical protein
VNCLERQTIEGDSPVTEIARNSLTAYPSKAGHVKSCLNLRGPSRKAKYYLETDSEQVPRGKGEKNPCEGSQKNLKPHAYKQFEGYAAQAECLRAYLLHHESAT